VHGDVVVAGDADVDAVDEGSNLGGGRERGLLLYRHHRELLAHERELGDRPAERPADQSPERRGHEVVI